MPTNLLKKYNHLLELLYSSFNKNIESIRKVFNRDFIEEIPVMFNNKPVFPTPKDGQNSMDVLFKHLTTTVTDESTKKREFESERSVRVHWVKFHLHQPKPNNLVSFFIRDENRIYLLDKDESYVVILEPLRKTDGFYLITAFKLGPDNFRKILKKKKNRGEDI